MEEGSIFPIRFMLWLAAVAGRCGWPLWLAAVAGRCGWPLWLAAVAGRCGWPLWLAFLSAILSGIMEFDDATFLPIL